MKRRHQKLLAYIPLAPFASRITDLFFSILYFFLILLRSLSLLPIAPIDQSPILLSAGVYLRFLSLYVYNVSLPNLSPPILPLHVNYFLSIFFFLLSLSLTDAPRDYIPYTQ